MLSLQNLDLDTHVKLKKNEILEKELQFYNSANNSVQQSSAVLAGFAFSGLSMSLEKQDDSSRDVFRTMFVISSTICVALNLVTLCAATFASLYSVRLALRGADDSVENSVKSVRGEYKFVLSLFCGGIVAFFASIALMGFYKYDKLDAYCMLFLGMGGILIVFYLLRRASQKFYLSKSQRYLSNKTSMYKTGNNNSSSSSSGDVKNSNKNNNNNDQSNNSVRSGSATSSAGLPYTRNLPANSTQNSAIENDDEEQHQNRQEQGCKAQPRRKSTLRSIANFVSVRKTSETPAQEDSNSNADKV
ncbi:hypothetical protein ScalyP_jg5827 [Parmales sp. scaly parma]|nr:hypothetical protein ScalyP_jg5827 [Parmales sp. scaly parma]